MYPQLSKTAIEELYQGSTVVETHPKFGPKVLINDKNGMVFKAFFDKDRLLSRGRFCQNYRRFWQFADRAKRLNERQVAAPRVTAVYHCPELESHWVCYQKIPGTDVYTLLQQGVKDVLTPCIHYWAKLHEQGIFFRGIHLANILRQDSGDFALVDIQDCHFYRSKLSLWVRARNIAHVFNRSRDRVFLPSLEAFMQTYFQASSLSARQQKWLIRWVKYYLK